MDSLYFNAHVPIRAESPKIWPSVVNKALYDKKEDDSECSPPPTEFVHASFSIATPPREPSPPSLINFYNEDPPPLPPKSKTKKQTPPQTDDATLFGATPFGATPFGAIPVEVPSYGPTPFGAKPVSLLDSEIDFAASAKPSLPKSSQSASSIVGKYLGQSNPSTPRKPFLQNDFSESDVSPRSNPAMNGARPKRDKSSSGLRGQGSRSHGNLTTSPVAEASLIDIEDRPRVEEPQSPMTSVPHNGARRKVKYQAPQPPKVQSQPSLVPRATQPAPRPVPKPKNQENDLQQREKLREMLAELRKDPFDEDLEANDGSYFPCEFCGDPYPVEFIMRHQVSNFICHVSVAR